MSWLSRLFRCKPRAKTDRGRDPEFVGSVPRAEVVGVAPELPAQEPRLPPKAEPTSDPLEAAALVVAGLDPLGGEHDQLRLTYSGTWDGPLFVTVTFGGAGGEVSVVDPGDDFRPNVMAVLSGEPVVPAATRQERLASVPAAALSELRALVDRDAWTLGEGRLRGTDGHWITVEVYSPSRGAHRGRDWCPDSGTAIGRITAATARVAALADPDITRSHWVERLSR